MISYDTLPFKVFHQVLDDFDKNYALLGIEDRGEAAKQWAVVLEQWKERHPSTDEREMLIPFKNALAKSIRLGKLVACLKFMLLFNDVEEEKQREVFESLRIKWSDDPLERLKTMNRLLEKAKTEKEIFDGRLKKVSDEIKARQKESKTNPRRLSMSDINKSIASLEMAGFNIENYEHLTCGKYDAMSAVIRERNKK